MYYVYPFHFNQGGVLVNYIISTLNNTGFLVRTLQYYYHATPGEPLQGSPGVAW